MTASLLITEPEIMRENLDAFCNHLFHSSFISSFITKCVHNIVSESTEVVFFLLTQGGSTCSYKFLSKH